MVLENFLLALHPKRSEPVRYRDLIGGYIERNYGGQAAETCSDDLSALDTLRNKVIADNVATEATKKTLVDYYGNLHVLEKRFPISALEDQVNLVFQWHDAFQFTEITELHNIVLEKAAIAFNIASLCSQLGYEPDATSGSSLVQAAKLFQESAGVFEFIKSKLMVDFPGPEPTDLSEECLDMLKYIMLGQAQECLLEKAKIDGRGPGTLARLACHISDLLDWAVGLVSSKKLKDHFEKTWKYLFQAKRMYYKALAFSYQASYLRKEYESSNIGKAIAAEISYLREAKEIMKKARKDSNQTKTTIKDAISEEYNVLSQRLESCEVENERMYFQARIPPISELDAVKPAALVKPTVPDYMLKPSASIMLNGVIPEGVAKHWSRYTSMVDGMTREQIDILDLASDEARLRLKELGLPESLEALEPHRVESIPDGVRFEVEKVDRVGGYDHLVDVYNQIVNMRSAVMEDLSSCSEELRQPKARTHRAYLQMEQKLKSYYDNLAVANSSDDHSKSMIDEYASQLKELSLGKVARLMPPLECTVLLLESTEPTEAVFSLRRGLQGIQILSDERASIEEAFKRTKNMDDIVEVLIALPHEADVSEVFKSHLSKYDELIQAVSENVKKQKELIHAIETANSVFRGAYDFEKWEKERQASVKKVRDSLAVFKSIDIGLQEGLEFYLNLQDAIQQLKRDIMSIETGGTRFEMPGSSEATVATRMSALSLMDPSPPTAEHTASNPVFRRHG